MQSPKNWPQNDSNRMCSLNVMVWYKKCGTKHLIDIPQFQSILEVLSVRTINAYSLLLSLSCGCGYCLISIVMCQFWMHSFFSILSVMFGGESAEKYFAISVLVSCIEKINNISKKFIQGHHCQWHFHVYHSPYGWKHHLNFLLQVSSIDSSFCLSPHHEELLTIWK